PAPPLPHCARAPRSLSFGTRCPPRSRSWRAGRSGTRDSEEPLSPAGYPAGGESSDRRRGGSSPREPDGFDVFPRDVDPAVGGTSTQNRRAEVDVLAIDPGAVDEDGRGGMRVMIGRDVRWQRAGGGLASEDHRADGRQRHPYFRAIRAERDRVALAVPLQRLRLPVEELTDRAGRAEQHGRLRAGRG